MSSESEKEVERIIAEDLFKADCDISRRIEPVIGEDSSDS